MYGNHAQLCIKKIKKHLEEKDAKQKKTGLTEKRRKQHEEKKCIKTFCLVKQINYIYVIYLTQINF